MEDCVQVVPEPNVSKEAKTRKKRRVALALPNTHIGVGSGSGRPANLVRQQLLDKLQAAPDIIQEIASGQVTQRIRFRVADVARYVQCIKCKATGAELSGGDDNFQVVELMASASPKDRIAALDFAAKYTIGKDISAEQVRERLMATLVTLRAILPPDLAETAITAIQPHWIR